MSSPEHLNQQQQQRSQSAAPSIESNTTIEGMGMNPPAFQLKANSQGIQFKKEEESAPKKTGMSFEEAKKLILAQGDRWGTDEDAIYRAITQCNERAKLKADPKVQATIADEMSGHDLWMAQLLFHYGSVAAFPQAIQSVWDATKGWGTDEDKIYEALQALDPAEIAKIANAPGIKNILKSELSGDDLSATDDILDGSYAACIKRHKDNVKKVADVLKTMESGDTLEKNSAEWIKDGRTKFFVGTATHDTDKRGKKVSGDEDKKAYFGAETNPFPSDAASYDAHIDKNAGISTAGKWTRGQNWGTGFNVLDPIKYGKSNSSIKGVIVHEVQHSADRHHDESGYAEGGVDRAWNRYQSEFRSYWIDGDAAGGKDDKSGTGTSGFDNEKQQYIFNHLKGGYTYVADNWKANKKITKSEDSDDVGKKFKVLVKAYTSPEGINLRNSIRIDDFYQALEGCTKTMAEDHAQIEKLFQAINALNAGEKLSISMDDKDGRYQSLMMSNLSDKLRAKAQLYLSIGDFPIIPDDGTVLV